MIKTTRYPIVKMIAIFFPWIVITTNYSVHKGIQSTPVLNKQEVITYISN